MKPIHETNPQKSLPEEKRFNERPEGVKDGARQACLGRAFQSQGATVGKALSCVHTKVSFGSRGDLDKPSSSGLKGLAGVRSERRSAR